MRNKNDDWKNRFFKIFDGSTEFALLESLTQSKTLTIMVIAMLSLLGGLCWFLFT